MRRIDRGDRRLRREVSPTPIGFVGSGGIYKTPVALTVLHQVRRTQMQFSSPNGSTYMERVTTEQPPPPTRVSARPTACQSATWLPWI